MYDSDVRRGKTTSVTKVPTLSADVNLNAVCHEHIYGLLDFSIFPSMSP